MINTNSHTPNPELDKTVKQIKKSRKIPERTTKLVLRTMSDVIKEWMKKDLAFRVSGYLSFIPTKFRKFKFNKNKK